MDLLKIIQEIEGLSNHDRFMKVIDQLKALNIDYEIQDYHTGVNIFTKPTALPSIGLASHFDVVPNSPGANDNGSAIAVCLEVLRRYQAADFEHVGLQVYFFDEEETGLKGSKAYVQEFGLKNLIALINLEMVGMGDQLALWPLSDQYYGKVLQCFEQVAKIRKVKTQRFDRIVTNTSDHVSFREAGLEDVFTITCISDQDIEVAYHYYKALEFEVERETLKSILQKAPLFRHYHQPTDVSKYLSEESLQMTVNAIWETIVNIDRRQ